MSRSEFELLESSVSIGSVTIENRAVMTAMGVNLGAAGGGVSDDLIAYYEARAQGGVGLIISELARVVDGAGAGEPCQLAARGLRDVPDLQRLVDAIHKYGTKLFIQLHHPGIMGNPEVTGTLLAAPSLFVEGLESVAHELTTEECEELVKAFVTGAKVAQLAGADGVELHAAHGYLINQFLSGVFNQRTDRYGGDIEGRMCFLLEIVAGIREVCGPRFPLCVRINAIEDIPDGNDIADAQKVAQKLEEAGVNALNVSCLSQTMTIEPGTYEQGWKKHMAAGIKEVVKIPLIAPCNIKEPQAAEALLEEGVCDLVGVARGHLADPQWCNKAFSGRADEIRLCIGCLTCFDEIVKLHRVKCAVNPATGREREYALPRNNGQKKNIAIVGGGPAGIEAALVLKERKFEPVIFCEGKRLGGTLNVADKGYGKTFITKYIDSLIAQVEKAGIEVRYGDTATVESVRAIQPQGVFVAAGALPFIPPVPGVDGENVCTAEDVLMGIAKPEGKVVLIGAGMTGIETAEELVSRGCDLSIVEMLDCVGMGIYPSVVSDCMGRIEPRGAQILLKHRLEKIQSDRVVLKRLEDGDMIEVEADWVVLALGVRPCKDLADEFKEAFPNVRVIGDAAKGGRIIDATQDARAKAFTYDLFAKCD